jgi:hypothetical protein
MHGYLGALTLIRRTISSVHADAKRGNAKGLIMKRILVAICAVVFGACVLIEHPQAQPGYVPRPPPPPKPVFNPSSPHRTVHQPKYESLSGTHSVHHRGRR